MPTYELKCRSCGRTSEVFLARIMRAGDRVCPSCGSRDVSQGLGGGFLTPISKESGAGCPPGMGFG